MTDQAKIAKMEAALIECEAYFEERADADGDVTGFTGNEEMKLLVECRMARGQLP